MKTVMANEGEQSELLHVQKKQRTKELTKEGIRPFECDICQQKFASKISLKEHKSRHTGARPYQCEICGKKFRQFTVYRRHYVVHADSQPHECHICQRRFSHVNYLRSHMKTHTGEKPYKCNLCEKRFAHLSDRTRHQKAHSGMKPYACDICGVCFTQASSCKRHVMKHRTVQPFPCEHCGMSFQRKVSLSTHMAKAHHVGMSSLRVMEQQENDNKLSVNLPIVQEDIEKKPYKCDLCEKRFARAYDRKRHQKVHQKQDTNDKKLYSCETCGARFTQYSSLRRHIREHNMVKCFQCDYCESTFKRNSSLHSHLRRSHKVELLFPKLEEEEELVSNETNSNDLFLNITPNEGEIYSQDKTSEIMLVNSNSHVETGMNEHILDGHMVSVDYVKEETLMKSETETEDYDGGNEGKLHNISYHVLHDDEIQQIVEIQQKTYENEDLAGSLIHEISDPGPYISPEINNISGNITNPSELLIDGSSVTLNDKGNKLHRNPDSTQTNFEEECLTDSSVVLQQSETPSKYRDIYDQTPKLNLLESDISRMYAFKPDFSSQEYYTWLSTFTDQCTEADVPLGSSTFKMISEVQRILTNILATPEGILAQRENFQILIDISKAMSDIIHKHLNSVLETLE